MGWIYHTTRFEFIQTVYGLHHYNVTPITLIQNYEPPVWHFCKVATKRSYLSAAGLDTTELNKWNELWPAVNAAYIEVDPQAGQKAMSWDSLTASWHQSGGRCLHQDSLREEGMLNISLFKQVERVSIMSTVWSGNKLHLSPKWWYSADQVSSV